MPNSLLAGKIQGNSPIRASAAPRRQPKRARNQFIAGQFPTHPNREFFCGLQGIKSGDQGKFRPDQGIPLSSAIWAFALPTIRSSRQIWNLAEKANRDAARCSKSPKPISSSASSIPRRAANRASTRTIGRSGASRWRRGSRRTRPSAPSSPWRGTEGSNPAPSSGESPANLTSSIRVDPGRPILGAEKAPRLDSGRMAPGLAGLRVAVGRRMPSSAASEGVPSEYGVPSRSL
jgi:hypothetical protein